jgi:hypothetical protein
MLSLQEISDRLELQQLATDYTYAIDTRDFDRLDTVFTSGAWIDYTNLGGIAGHYPEMKTWLEAALAPFGNFLHMIANFDLRIDGDTATGVIACFNPIETPERPGGRQVMFMALWYHDTYVRTAEGWRIKTRREERCCNHNVPADINASADA